jgi:pimeloyl-ACP methyl ester carboxylesterase
MLMPLAKMLHDAGHPVMTFDLRNHGESARDGLLRGQSPRYAIDHRAVVDELAGRLADGAHIACVGYSTSSWTALEMARLQPNLVRAVVCDSGPTLDLPATLSRMYRALRPTLPVWLRGPLVFAVTRAVFARAAVFFLKPAPWPMELGDHTVRLLFVAGEADPIARPDDVREQLAWYPKAESWFVPGAGHMQAHVVAAKEYGERVLALLAGRPDRVG